MPRFDVVIVGGGPAGLSAALVLGRCRRRILICDEGRPRNARSRAVHNCEGLFVQAGCAPQSDLAAQLGCAFTRRGAVITRKGSRTTVDSVFVAGDAADHSHAVVTAAASGAEAAFAINRELREAAT